MNVLLPNIGYRILLLQKHTLVLGLSSDLGEELDKVGEIISEELGADDEVFARVVRVELGAEELSLSLDAESRAPLGVLWRAC